MIGLTPKQRDVMLFIQTSIDTNGYSPTYDEIGEELQIGSKSSVHRFIKILEDKGYISQIPAHARSIAVLRRLNSVVNIAGTKCCANCGAVIDL